MYSKIDKGFQVAFDIAWGAFVSGSIPIGACILNENDEVVSVGQNQIFTDGDGLISHHQLAHAEANAILQISEYPRSNEHQNIRKYTLYTTMEPCPFCFGAIVMGSIRHVKFAARDKWAGAASLNSSSEYIKQKSIIFNGPFEDIEFVQIAIQTCFEISRKRVAEVLLTAWSEDCPKGVETGKRLHESGELSALATKGANSQDAYDFVLARMSN